MKGLVKTFANADAKGMYDPSYPTLEGISRAYAWNSGRIAGALLTAGSKHFYEKL